MEEEEEEHGIVTLGMGGRRESIATQLAGSQPVAFMPWGGGGELIIWRCMWHDQPYVEAACLPFRQHGRREEAGGGGSAACLHGALANMGSTMSHLINNMYMPT